MNIFRFSGDMFHLISILLLLLKIYATKSCSGISLKTQELYAIVFLARYLNLFTVFISFYNTVMKLVFIGTSFAIVYCMRCHYVVKRSYDRHLDTFRHHFLVFGTFLLALLLHDKFTFLEVGAGSSLAWYKKGQRPYRPLLRYPALDRSSGRFRGESMGRPSECCYASNVVCQTYFDVILGQIFWAFSIYLEAVAILPQLVLLQRSGNVDNLTGQYVFFLGAYRALYILNWIYRYFTEAHFSGWI
ncbi:hypothetical protein OSB04_003101, partial [Centaurea solstitialis]